jgi:hypothetical protein
MNYNEFKQANNQSDYSISPFWFWNDKIEDSKMLEQLSIMHRIHADAPIIHARGGLINEYLSDDWFARIQSAVTYAKEHDMKIVLYDEDNWPSGNCNFTITKDEESREHHLEFNCLELDKGDVYEVNTNGVNYMNITLINNGDDNKIDLLSLADKDGLILYNMEEPSKIFEVKLRVNDYEPYGKFCVDYLSKEQLRKFIASTHEKYYEHFKEDFGKTITTIFMDETRFFNAIPWTKELPLEFKKRKGYDILSYLPLLIAESEKSALLRYDYYDVISDMYREATFMQIYDWAEEKNIKTTGHLLGEETLASQSRFNGDIMRQYAAFHIPGIDHLGNGIGSLDAKICASAAHNYGKDRISCEAFGASGWDMNYEDMVKISNWLFQQGINYIIIHGFYYSIRDERSKDWPPSYFYQWRYWDSMEDYCKMASRMTYMLSGGRNEADVLVYYPIETFWAHFEPDFMIQTCYFKEGPFVKNDMAENMDREFQYLCSKLSNKNMEFDIWNSDAVSNFKVERNKLVNTLTGTAYSVVVLPYVELLPDKVVELLNEFLEQGGVVLNYNSERIQTVSKMGRHHFEELGLTFQTEKSIRIKDSNHLVEECKKYIVLPYEIIEGEAETYRTQMNYPNRIHDPYLHDGENVFGIGISRYIKDGKRIYNFTNYNDREEYVKVSLLSGKKPVLYIPETGEEMAELDYSIVDSGASVFGIKIPKNRTYFLVEELEFE